MDYIHINEFKLPTAEAGKIIYIQYNSTGPNIEP